MVKTREKEALAASQPPVPFHGSNMPLHTQSTCPTALGPRPLSQGERHDRNPPHRQASRSSTTKGPWREAERVSGHHPLENLLPRPAVLSC